SVILGDLGSLPFSRAAGAYYSIWEGSVRAHELRYHDELDLYGVGQRVGEPRRPQRLVACGLVLGFNQHSRPGALMSNKTLGLPAQIYDYLLSVSVREPQILQRLRAETARLPMAMMQVAPEQGQLLSLLV